MPDSVKLIECPRDAWQGLKGLIPASIKAAYLRVLIEAGFKHIDAVSFVSPKAVPQMADSEQVLEQLGDVAEDVELIGIVVNEMGAERAAAVASQIATVGFPYSISPTFLERNQNQTMEDAYETLEKIAERADKAGQDVVCYISMAFGNPYGDPWSAEEVATAVELLEKSAIRSISLADTVGLATPEQVRALVEPIIRTYDHLDIGVHLHSRPADAVNKVLAAYDAGCRRFDSAIGGLGGCPFAQDEMVGNIPTEAVLEALALRGAPMPSLKSLSTLTRSTAGIAAQFGGVTAVP
jgi:hydroxymethylglutaryl-CoA lyase